MTLFLCLSLLIFSFEKNTAPFFTMISLASLVRVVASWIYCEAVHCWSGVGWSSVQALSGVRYPGCHTEFSDHLELLVTLSPQEILVPSQRDLALLEATSQANT